MMGKSSRERAQEGSDEFNFRARQSSADFKRGVETSSSTFKSTNESRLGSGQSSIKKNPTDMAASGETAMVAFYTVATMLGSVAAAALLGRRGRGNS